MSAIRPEAKAGPMLRNLIPENTDSIFSSSIGKFFFFFWAKSRMLPRIVRNRMVRIGFFIIGRFGFEKLFV